MLYVSISSMMTIELNDRHLDKNIQIFFPWSLWLGVLLYEEKSQYLNSSDSFFKIKPRDLGINTAKLAE